MYCMKISFDNKFSSNQPEHPYKISRYFNFTNV